MRISTVVGNVSIDINTDRLDDRISTAQRLLNMQIAADCDPLIPFRQGALRGSVDYPKGIDGGEISWGGVERGVPYGMYIYRGEIYGPNIPRFDDAGNVVGWYSPPKKHPTGRKMTMHTPGTTDHFFDVAKSQHGNDWVRLVKEAVGRG